MTLIRYLSQVFATRFLAVLLALSALTLLIELLDATKRVFGAQGGGAALATYTALRLPLSVERLFPLAVLIAAVLTFHKLVRENEATILRAAGLSGWQLVWALVPVVAVLALVQLSLTNWIAPAAERAFVDWWERIAPAEQPSARVLWMRVGERMVSVERIEEDGRRLEGVTEYRRDGAGRLTGVMRAREAVASGEGWMLHEVQVTALGQAMASEAEMAWPDGPRPANVRELLRPTERLSAGKAQRILSGQWSGAASHASYQTRLMKTLRAPVLPALMLLLATPALGGGRRTGGMGRGMTLGLGLGVGFLIVDGFFGSMSEAGTVPAPLAIWAAPAIFAALGGWLMLRAEA